RSVKFQDAYRALGSAVKCLETEFKVFQKLSGLDCVARVVDYGTYPHSFSGRSIPAFFLVQESIAGEPLNVFLERTTLPVGFHGIACPAEYAIWARRLASALLRVHATGVVHGDLHWSNVFVRPNRQPALVGFGDWLF